MWFSAIVAFILTYVLFSLSLLFVPAPPKWFRRLQKPSWSPSDRMSRTIQYSPLYSAGALHRRRMDTHQRVRSHSCSMDHHRNPSPHPSFLVSVPFLSLKKQLCRLR